MGSIYSFSNYKDFLRNWMETRPQKGHGELRRMALHLKIHPTRMSQIFSGSQHLSMEQACALGAYLALGPSEVEFFLLLLQRERAGTQDLRHVLDRQLEKARNRVKKDPGKSVGLETVPLEEAEKAIFYSSWLYSAVQLLTHIPESRTPEAIADRLATPLPRIKEIIEFLIRGGLCVEGADGLLSPGRRSTYVPYSSLLYGRHHQNWRIKALEHAERFRPNELTYTAALSLPREALAEGRAKLLEAIREINASATDEGRNSETVAALTIDWFEVL